MTQWTFYSYQKCRDVYIQTALFLFFRTNRFNFLLEKDSCLVTLHKIKFPTTTYQYRQGNGLLWRQSKVPYKLVYHRKYQLFNLLDIWDWIQNR